MQAESFDTKPLQQVIPSYLYKQYDDDETLQAFVSSFNGLTQGYLDWFNETPLSVYTLPSINGPLLDWVGQGLYGISRPVISNTTSRAYGSYNTVPYNALAYNRRRETVSGTTEIADDDVYKRVLTWHLYLGDGRQMSLQWLRRRIARFIFGANGSDIPVDYLPQIGLQRAPIGYAAAFGTPPYNTQAYNSHKTRQVLASHSLQISVPAGQISEIFKALLIEGYLALPFQIRFSVVIRP
jgi:hypothetical protein